MFVKKRNGDVEEVKFDKITKRINKQIYAEEKKYLDAVIVAQKTVAAIYPGITTEELDNVSANICINMCTSHHLYSNLAGRILVSNLHKKTSNTFVEKQELIQQELNLLDPSWLQWIKENREELNNMIDYDRDYLFDYFGFKTLERAYLLKKENKIIERPQDMFMRVSSFINKGNLELIKQTYDLMSYGFYTHASPTLFNAGNKRSQLSSCFLLGTDDSMDGITKTWVDVAKISKWGGGIGLHISNIRAKDSLIRGTNGPANGIIPMLKVYNEIARYVDQCFVGSTKVYTENGLIPIEEIKPNDKVFTIDGSLQEVERIYCDKYEGKILNFKIIHDYENIKVTDSHPFYVIKNYDDVDFKNIKQKLDNKLIQPEWINAKDIKNTDFIGISIPTYVKDNNNLDESDCYFYALILRYGTLIDNQYIITFLISDNLNIEFLKNYLERVGFDYKYEEYISYCDFKWNICSKMKFSKSQIYKNNKKYFDNNMLHLPKEKLKWILKGFIFDDKTIKCNLNFKEAIQFMLLKFGILCEYVDSSDTMWSINGGKPHNDFTIVLPKIKEVYELFDLGTAYSDNDHYILYDNILYTQLEKVSEEDIKTCVYDLEIKNNHNYLTQAGLVHNGGKRKGSIAIYLEPHHPDIMAFLDLRKNFGAETERARDLFLAIWVSDLFMKQVESDGDWYLMCPDKCPGLTDTHGDKYEELYWSYVEQNKYNKKVKAREIMKAILDSQLETGTPYLAFKDHVNKKSNQMNIGTIKSSNLCCEILEYSDANQYAVCNLASIAINKFVIPFKSSEKWTIYTKDNCKYCKWTKSSLINNNYNFEEKIISKEELVTLVNLENPTYPQIFYGNKYIGGYSDFFKFISGSFDYDKLYNVAYIATKNLNNVIDINYYPVIEAKKSNILHRPIGLGIQGLADALVLLKINFDSDESIDFNKKMMETIYLAAMTASADMSKQRYDDLMEMREYNLELPEYYDQDIYIKNEKLHQIYHKHKPNKCELVYSRDKHIGAYSSFQGSPISEGKFQFDLWTINRDDLYYKDKWLKLEEQIKTYGIRNSLVTALMPTASTSQILGNNECFEFFTNNIYTRRTLAGDFPLVNKYLIDELNNIGLWDNDMKQLILANNGSISDFNNIPEQLRKLFQTIWEIKQIWILKNALARAPFVCQTQSMNIFQAVPDYQKLYSSHFWAWKNGLKTGIYYLRSKPAKDAKKFTIDPNIQLKLELLKEPEICESCSA
jgi:ribonucleotide reductase alpha subunit